MVTKLMKTLLIATVFIVGSPAWVGADTSIVMRQVKKIQMEWAKLNYLEDFKKVNYKELQTLAELANKTAEKYSGSAEALVWDAIVLSTLAEKKGGLGALSLVKKAKHKLELAEEINPKVLDGSIYTSLATLYSKVPGWPLGFGSSKKARLYFEKALELNPNGLDINFFYAEFLADNDEDDLALQYIQKALDAPTLVGRPIADKGRRVQAEKLRKILLNS